MRKILRTKRLVVLALLLMLVSAPGCTKQIIADQLRTSVGSFMTGVFNSAVDASLRHLGG